MSASAPARQTVVAERFEVRGVVQGVGFRPFVHRVATELGIAGFVGNDSARVFIEVAAPAEVLDTFEARLRDDAPPLAHVQQISRAPIEPIAAELLDPPGSFRIVGSESADGPRTLVPPDSAVCDDCLREMRDPLDRRYRHPFITCTNCGPRFTIIRDLPYDRHNTSMASFAMCDCCRDEYSDPTNRRYHAQPIGCHECGPTLSFATSHGSTDVSEVSEVVAQAADVVKAGHVLAVKGLGGFHLAVDATDETAVARLRANKSRPDKPLAVMVDTIDQARRLVHLTSAEEHLLRSPARPVVLAPHRAGANLASSVAPENPMVGVMLAYTPVHHLLFDAVGVPLVMTSANISGEPITYRDDEIESQIGPIADGLLTNDRPIVAPCDDSVVRVVDGALLPVRRARGYAPLPVALAPSPRSAVGEAAAGALDAAGLDGALDGGGEARPTRVLAVGGELKNTFCIAEGERAWVSPHIGDMGSLATLRTFEHGAERFQTMYDIAPDAVVVDAHPGYQTTRWAHRTAGPNRSVIEVQHHHAHVAAVIAEHRLDPTTAVVGFAFDGTGYGDDGTIWGGEVLRASALGYERLAHLVPVPLPGGDAAIEHPARVALAHLRAAGIEWASDLAPVAATSAQDRALLARQFESGFGCVPTTSMGRLFDAAASLVGLRQRVHFEAQAAIDLEHAARRNEADPPIYRFGLGARQTDRNRHAERDRLGTAAPAVEAAGFIDQRPVVAAMVDDLRNGRSIAEIADGFHHAVAQAVAELVALHADPAEAIVLSGGVFQNALLTERVLHLLGDRVYTHQLVPPNDGGLALGQALIALHRPPCRPRNQSNPDPIGEEI